MKPVGNKQWADIDAQLRQVLATCSSELPAGSASEVMDYIEHGEYEIAFEGMFLDLIDAGVFPRQINTKRCRLLGLALRLDRESVLDDVFWHKFMTFLGHVTEHQNSAKGT